MIQFLKFVPVQLTFFLIVGIVIGNYFNFQPNILVWASLVLAILFTTIYWFENKRFQPSFLFPIVVFLSSFSVGIGTITYKNQLNKQQHYSNQAQFAVNKATLLELQIKKIGKPNAYYNKYEAEVKRLNNHKTIGKILVTIEKDSLKELLEIDDYLLVNAPFKSIVAPLNPYSFNYKKYLQNHQIHHQIQINHSQYFKLQNNSKTLKGIAAKIRKKINSSLKENGFKNNELAVINALLLGQRNTLSSDLLESYVNAGAIHILAVSGLHIGIILLMLSFIVKPLHYFKNGKLWASLFIVSFLWLYAILAGLSPSVVRAVTMFTALTIGMYLNRATNVYNNLIISMFFLLLFNPYYLFEIGFQLSYLAVFSIVWLQPKLVNIWKPKWWILNKLWQLFTVSLAAQVGVFPLSLFYFHQFPGLFFISNLVIIPFLGIILIVGFVLIFAALANILPQILGNTYIFIIKQLNYFVAWISEQETFIVQDIVFSFAAMLATFILIFAFFKWIEKKIFFRFVWVLISVLLLQSVFIFEKYKLHTSKEFIVFNKSKKSIIGKRVGAKLMLDATKSITQKDYTIKPYLVNFGLGDNFQISEKKNIYKFKNETILVVDSLGSYNFNSVEPTLILLQQSPKINLERLLKTMNPKQIIADGSNYKSFVKKWEETCIKNKTPFYNTMQKGAFILK